MITALRALAELLARDPLTVDEVVEYLGTVVQSYTGNLLVKPRNALFSAASVVRQLNADKPAHVELTPADPPALDTLAQAFGTYRTIPAEEKIPPQAIFYLDLPGQPYRVALIAQLKRDRVTSITLRRDRRL